MLDAGFLISDVFCLLQFTLTIIIQIYLWEEL